jgi:lipopolysaccharide/colanic/teichoic acid biosynthesis glycosyltransferase
MIIIAIVICIDDPSAGPFFKQKRVGRHGKEFYMYKFRTMRPNAEALLEQLKEKNEMDGPVFKMKEDPRITKVGKFYRKWSIDELLQLINVINGSMSVVGPRPPIPREVEDYTEEQRQRLMVKGGLLCLWQIQKNRHDLKFEDWISLDLDYIENQSTWLDIKIIFKGFFMVLFDRSGE